MKQGSLLNFFKPKQMDKRSREDVQSQSQKQKPISNQKQQQNIESRQTLPSSRNSSDQQQQVQQQVNQIQSEDSEEIENVFKILDKKKSQQSLKKKKMIIDSDSEGGGDDYVPDIYMDEEEISKDLEEMKNRGNQKKKGNLKRQSSDSSNDLGMEIEQAEFKKKKNKSTVSFAPSTKLSSQQMTTPKLKNVSQKQSNISKKSSNTDLVNVDEENQVENAGAGLNELEDRTPYWATKEYLKDKNGVKYGEPGYDPTTLYCPPAEIKKLTNAKQQYWEIKSENFDKIVFFKLGKFYELFYDDALITNIHLDLNWMGKKMHTGFPEKCLEKYATLLVEMGYKVAVVEQMETPKQMKERVEKNKYNLKQSEKIVKREICQVFTKGTFQSEGDLQYQPRYLMSVRCMGNNIAIAIVEASTFVVTLGYLQDNDNYNLFKTLLYQVKPNELVYDGDNVPAELIKILKSGFIKPVLSPVSNKNSQWDARMSMTYIEQKYGEFNQGNWPSGLKYYADQEEVSDTVFQALSGVFSYYNSILLLENVIASARYQIYDPKKGVSNTMILDSQCLQHLEILEGSLNINNPIEGSLLHFIDKTVTPFGKRMLKNWLCAPLIDLDRINDRFDSIEDLHYHATQRDKFRQALKKLPDIERLCARTFKYSVKNNKADQAIMFEDISTARLIQFRDLLKNLKKGYEIIQNILIPLLPEMKAKRLKKLLKQAPQQDEQMEIEEQQQQQNGEDEQNNFIFAGTGDKSEEGLLPDIASYVTEFENYIEWKQNVPHPVPGIIEAYDQSQQELKNIEQQFDDYLKEIRKQFGNDKSIIYDHSKFKYQLEIKEEKVKGNKKPKDFEFTSGKKGVQRFHTPYIKELLEEYEVAEENQKQQLGLFAQFIFKQFQENYKVWDQLVSILSELDCLSSLSIASFYAEGDMVRPNISYPLDGVPRMDIRNARHPCLQTQGVNFIPNDVVLGTKENEGKNLMLLTGPNMGGKSTALRMSCIIAILGQIGCYVPATDCDYTIVDRIFTRIGASDRLTEGKSTFYIEMEETFNAVKYGSANSLVIMDELGRGTSTYDGVAIAYSILKYMIEEVKCRCLFATHYHILLQEFQNQPEICFYNMACHVSEKEEKVIFLYKLRPGSCSNSFGINVAKVVGIHDSIIQTAKQKAKEFEDDLNIQKTVMMNQSYKQIMGTLFQQNIDSNATTTIQQLTHAFHGRFGLQTPQKSQVPTPQRSSIKRENH